MYRSCSISVLALDGRGGGAEVTGEVIICSGRSTNIDAGCVGVGAGANSEGASRTCAGSLLNLRTVPGGGFLYRELRTRRGGRSTGLPERGGVLRD